jgi:hypothetical protein
MANNGYTPDRWKIIKITPVDTTIPPHYRVFACWYGGFTGSDSWRMNSGIMKATKEDSNYLFEGSSGSVYVCNENTYGISGYGQNVLNNLITNSREITIEVLDENTDWLNLVYN